MQVPSHKGDAHVILILLLFFVTSIAIFGSRKGFLLSISNVPTLAAS
jgi:hypothetical protein